MKRHTFVLTIGVLVLSALSYGWIFSHRLEAVPAINYEYRDDAVITLSHARNLVEYGFIGVSPSGERVEGFSAPLQFWTAAALYRIWPFDFRTFLRWQMLVGTVLLGTVVAGLMLSGGPIRECGTWYLFVLVAVVASAEILAQSRAFLLWHASGMENVYKNVALLALLWAFDNMLRTSRIRNAAVILVFAASISRIDSIVPVSALLLAFSILWAVRHRTGQAARFAALSVLPWAAYMVWRAWYFGQWIPNTGIAQHISIDDRIARAIRAPTAAIADYYAWLVAVGGSLHAVQFFWLPILIVWMRRSRTALDRCVLLTTGGVACLAQYTLFGPARMDSTRTVSELAVYSTLLVPWALAAKTEWRVGDALIGAGMIAVSLVVVEARQPDRTEVGWAEQYFEPAAAQAAAIAARNELPRPSLANADLGVVSWSKQFNMVDFGTLGSAVLSRVHDPPRYIAEFAKPDIIEIHDAWSCMYHDLFTNRFFVAEYVAVSAVRTPWLLANCNGAPQARTGYWVRRAIMKDSGSPERAFLDALRVRLDPDVIRKELARCLSDPGIRPCDYVGRTVFRYVPELKRQRKFDDIAALLRSDRRLAIEYAYFASSIDPTWWHVLVAWADPIPMTVQPSSVSVLVRAGAETSLRSEVLLDLDQGTAWHLSVPADAWFDVQPRQGAGPATLSITPHGVPEGKEQRIAVPIFGGDGMSPSVELSVGIKSVAATPNLPPAGFVDAPGDPVHVTASPILFQGWAVDETGLKRVWVGCPQKNGTITELATAIRGGERPDISRLFPASPDRMNAAWAIRLSPNRACLAGPSAALQFFAEDVEGLRTMIGTRTLIRP